MEQSDGTVPLRAENIYSYQRDLEDLSDELGSRIPNHQKVIELLGDVARLKNMQNFTDIGEEAASWESEFKDNEKQRPIYKSAISVDEESELTDRVSIWISKYEQSVSEMVVFSPETDLSTEKLSQGPETFLDIDISDPYLSVLRDLGEACDNLLVGTYTSSEFMSLRAIEGLLRQWYESEKGENPGNMNWNNVFEALDASEDVDTFSGMGFLSPLRKRRNEVAHPDAHSTKRDAEMTLQRAFDITEKIVARIESATN
ncbi:hypothetical protein [Halococcus sp. IIIV-5B]|uniref:hypothetical protein n=1 Tax=Halococcus sp. IIIV-5B TaxID=2321230 RepID=UPI0011C38111|nr:hypothetical protein [Halococcus sp. IIIV-5B]